MIVSQLQAVFFHRISHRAPLEGGYLIPLHGTHSVTYTLVHSPSHPLSEVISPLTFSWWRLGPQVTITLRLFQSFLITFPICFGR